MRVISKKPITFLIASLVLFLVIGFSDLGEYNINELTELIKNPNSENVSSDRKLEENEVIISRVIDGDTLIVLNHEGREEIVRLLLIDTPETVHPTKEEQKYGKEASEFAKKHLTQGKKVILERGNPEKDIYDRTLGFVFVDGINFNQLIVEEGYARVAYTDQPNTKYLDQLKEAEKRAKTKKLNIWSIEGYVTNNGFDMSVID